MLIIRKAKPDDAGRIATCLLLAMESIVFRFIGINDHAMAKAFMLYLTEREHNQYSWQNCWVAEQEGLAIAAANLYDGARLQQLRQPVLDYINTRFKTTLAMEDETQAGEYYIDSLGVDIHHRGKGIGSKLLQFLIEEYVRKEHQTLGLLVDEDNPAAKRLYLKLGFRSAGSRQLFGKNMNHLQHSG